MEVQMLLQESTCAAIRDARLLYQFTNMNTKNEVVLSFECWCTVTFGPFCINGDHIMQYKKNANRSTHIMLVQPKTEYRLHVVAILLPYIFHVHIQTCKILYHVTIQNVI
jgi:hypothetical protein